MQYIGLARMSAMCQKEGCPERIGIGLVYTIEGAIKEFQDFETTLFVDICWCIFVYILVHIYFWTFQLAV